MKSIYDKPRLSNETTKIEFYKIEKFCRALNINLFYLIKNNHKIININNDLTLEGNNNFYNCVLNLCSVGAFSYSSSNLGYGVSIGRYCSLASNIKIMGAHHFPEWISTSPHFYSRNNHNVEPESVSHLQRTQRQVIIGNDVWIGADVVLKGNITIGDGAIIASNSIVTKNIPPYMIVGGNPARIIRPRFSDDLIEKLLHIKWWRFHKDDLKGLMANHPESFVEQLQERIDISNINEYTPKIITKDDLVNASIDRAER